MSSRSDDDALFFTLVVFAIGLGFLTYKFSNLIGVDWETGLEMIGKMTLVLVVWGGWKKLNPYSDTTLWPVALAGLFWAWFPALDVWAYQENSFSSLGSYSYQKTEVKIAWFGQWYSKALILLTTIFGGYFIDGKVREI